jgi:hypothetical protein
MKTINWFVLFKEIIAVYSEKHTKTTNTLYGQSAELLVIKTSGTYSNHRALKS